MVTAGVYSSISYTGGSPEKIKRIKTAQIIINKNSPAKAEKRNNLEKINFFKRLDIYKIISNIGGFLLLRAQEPHL